MMPRNRHPTPPARALARCFGVALLLVAGTALASPAPAFALPDLEGRTAKLAELTARGPVLLVFWATECVYCFAHIRDLNALQEKYRDAGLQVVGINIGAEPRAEVAAYAEDNGVRYRLLADPLRNLDVAHAYQVPATPTFALIDTSGELRYRGHRLSSAEARLQQLLDAAAAAAPAAR